MPENTVKVDRTTPWGKPFIVGKPFTRAASLAYYKMMLSCFDLVSHGDDLFEASRKARAHIQLNLESLRGKNLACWCSLPKPGESDLCHAAMLLICANA